MGVINRDILHIKYQFRGQIDHFLYIYPVNYQVWIPPIAYTLIVPLVEALNKRQFQPEKYKLVDKHPFCWSSKICLENP